MSILDLDMRDEAVAYDAWVQRAPEWEPAIQQWAMQKQGSATNIHWIHHIIWRFFKNIDTYHTLRNAMEERIPGVGPTPVEPPPVVSHPPTQPPQPLKPGVPVKVGIPIKISNGPFHRRLYSYWSNAWMHPDGSTWIFAGRNSMPVFFRLDPSGSITEVGPMVPFPGETEGWYWDEHGWIYIPQGPHLLRVNPFTQEKYAVMSVPWTDHALWQTHSSHDGEVHSATLKDPSYNKIATVVDYRGKLLRWDSQGELDESIIDASGEHLVMQANHHNYVVRLDRPNDVEFVDDAKRAIAHCDTGWKYIVGEADKPDPGACVMFDLTQPMTLDRCKILFTTDNMGHISIKAGRVLHSDAQKLGLVGLDGSYTHLLDHGAHVTDYETQVRANLSPCGTRATYLVDGALYVLPL